MHNSVCSNCQEGTLERYYIRTLQVGGIRGFETVNLFQCDNEECHAFFAFKGKSLIMLEIREIKLPRASFLNSSLIRGEEVKNGGPRKA
jgi:hypothetical protein